MARRELTFQNHIIDSYKSRGGYGHKWASDWQKGPPDLVLSLPGFGSHLMEVKHRPTWTIGGKYKNPLTPKQKDVATKYWLGGGTVMAGVVIGEQAIGSHLCLIPATTDEVILLDTLSTPYKAGEGKYDVRKLLSFWRSQYGWTK